MYVYRFVVCDNYNSGINRCMLFISNCEKLQYVGICCIMISYYILVLSRHAYMYILL